MKLFFRIIFKMILILTILTGCATTGEIKETDPIALLNQGIAFAEKGQYDRSIAYFNKAIVINPRFAEAYNNRGVAYGMGKGQYDKAISDFNKVIEINLRDAEAYYNRGVAYSKRGVAYTEKGQHDKAISDFDKVIPDLNKAIEINPRYADAYNQRGIAYLGHREKQKACSDWKRACELGLCEYYEMAKKKGDCK